MKNQYKDAILFLREKTNLIPKVGIVLGSGLGNVVDDIDVEISIPYKEIPGFIPPTIEGHSGNLVFGLLMGVPVVAMQGRNHFYEGHTLQEITFPIRIMKLLGANILMTSNATGGMNPDYEIGDIMLVNDHINLLGDSPLRGANLDEFGPRFPDMSQAYDKGLLLLAKRFALNNSIKVHEGVLAAVCGPAYETPAEYKYLRYVGADAIGMSTIPEVLVARHMDMKVFSMSLITDLGVPGKIVKITHEEVQEVANQTAVTMSSILKGVITLLD